MVTYQEYWLVTNISRLQHMYQMLLGSLYNIHNRTEYVYVIENYCKSGL